MNRCLGIIRVLRPVLILLILAPVYSQQIYFEPEYGYYGPSNWTRIDSIIIAMDTIRQDYEFNQAPRVGGNLGLRFTSGYEVYVGYKQWPFNSKTTPVTKVNTFSVGIRNSAFLKDRNLGYRAGFEYFRTRVTSDLDTSATGGVLWTFKGKGSGTALEAGIIYLLFDRVCLFAGFDYLMYNVAFDRLTNNNVTYTRKEFGLSKSKATVDMTGMNIKLSISFIFSAPLKFDN